MTNIKKLIKQLRQPSIAREATQAEINQLLFHLFYKSGLSSLDICRAVLTKWATVFDHYFSYQSGYADRLMVVGLPDGKLHHYAWDWKAETIYELPDEEFERCTNL